MLFKAPGFCLLTALFSPHSDTTPNVWLFVSPQDSSVTRTSYPMIQLNSDTISLENKGSAPETACLHMPIDSQLSPGLLTNQLKLEVCTTRFNLFARAPHRTQESSLLTRLPVYYRRIQLRNSQMGKTQRAVYGGKGTELPCPLNTPPSQHLHMCPDLEALQTQSFGFLCRQD